MPCEELTAAKKHLPIELESVSEMVHGLSLFVSFGFWLSTSTVPIGNPIVISIGFAWISLVLHGFALKIWWNSMLYRPPTISKAGKHCLPMFSIIPHRYAGIPSDKMPDKVDFRSKSVIFHSLKISRFNNPAYHCSKILVIAMVCRIPHYSANSRFY